MKNLPLLDNAGRFRPTHKRPLLREVRAVLKSRRRLRRFPVLQHLPHGDGHPVFVLPGFMTNDLRTRNLRRFLADLGYQVYGWGKGVNWGPTDRTLAAIERRLRDIRQRHGCKVTLVGHSMGGMLARDLAKKFPDDVRQLIIMGTPCRLPVATSLAVPFRLLARFHRSAHSIDLAEVNRPPPETLPVTAIYTRDDGIVAWQSCREQPGPLRENVEVRGDHSTLPSNAAVLRVLADRLALPEGGWQPYAEAERDTKAA